MCCLQRDLVHPEACILRRFRVFSFFIFWSKMLRKMFFFPYHKNYHNFFTEFKNFESKSDYTRWYIILCSEFINNYNCNWNFSKKYSRFFNQLTSFSKSSLKWLSMNFITRSFGYSFVSSITSRWKGAHNKPSSISFQQYFSIKQTYIEFNKLILLSTKYFEFQQFRGYKINNLQVFNNLQNE